MKKSTKQNRLPRFPKILADEVLSALLATDHLGSEREVLLERFRRNRMKCIATWGLNNTGASVPDLEPIPWQYQDQIAKLDAAFEKLHRYNSGKANEYMAKDVEHAIRSYHASQPRNRENSYKEICDFLRKRDYQSSANKKSLVQDACVHFGISESPVRRAIQVGGLARPKKSTGS